MALGNDDEVSIKEGNDNPIYSHTLSEFISAGSKSNCTTYDKFCFQYYAGGIQYVVLNVLDDYMDELIKLSSNIYLTNEELKTYNYRPKLLSADVYGTTDLAYFILKLNGLCDVKEFHDINPIKMMTTSFINEFLSDILNNEKTNIDRHNAQNAFKK